MEQDERDVAEGAEPLDVDVERPLVRVVGVRVAEGVAAQRVRGERLGDEELERVVDTGDASVERVPAR